MDATWILRIEFHFMHFRLERFFLAHTDLLHLVTLISVIGVYLRIDHLDQIVSLRRIYEACLNGESR